MLSLEKPKNKPKKKDPDSKVVNFTRREIDDYRRSIVNRNRNDNLIDIASRIDKKLQQGASLGKLEKRDIRGYDIPSPENILLFSGYNPNGNPSTKKLTKKLTGEKERRYEYASPEAFNSERLQATQVMWSRDERKVQKDVPRFMGMEIDRTYSYIDYMNRELDVSNMFTESAESSEIFDITLNYLLANQNIDTLMAHSTGAQVLLTFLDVLSRYVYRADFDSIPISLRRKMVELEMNGLKLDDIYRSLLSKINVIQIVRGNVDISVLRDMNLKLVQDFKTHNIQIFNYYNPQDSIINGVQKLQNVKKLLNKKLRNVYSEDYRPVGNQIIEMSELGENWSGYSIINRLNQGSGELSHEGSIMDPRSVEEYYRDRSDYLNSLQNLDSSGSIAA